MLFLIVQKFRQAAVTGFFSILLVGCPDIESRHVESSALRASMRVSSSGNNETVVSVRLTTGSGFGFDSVELSSSDSLFANYIGESKTLVTTDDVIYTTSFAGDAGGAELEISFERDSDISILESTVAVPTAFEVTAPDSQAVFTSGESITVTWSPGLVGDVVFFSGSCTDLGGESTIRFEETFFDVENPGVQTAAVDEILNASGQHSRFDPDIPCATSIDVTRTFNGSIDREFGRGGDIEAEQRRSIDVRLNP